MLGASAPGVCPLPQPQPPPSLSRHSDAVRISVVAFVSNRGPHISILRCGFHLRATLTPMLPHENPPPNKLYYGATPAVLRDYIPDQSVDLIYLDPPFNSRQDYNVLFDRKINESRKIDAGARSASQITAFKDTWEWNEEAARSYEQVVEQGGRVAEAMRAFRTLLGGSDMLAYLAMMAPRLVELRRVLKESGSIYLHCD